MTMQLNHVCKPHQRGVVLVTSLIFLSLMTIIGVTAMQGTTQEAKMANNAAQRGVAFQVAEAGLRTAELFVANTPNAGDSVMPGVFSAPLPVPSTDLVKYWMDGYDWEALSLLYEDNALPTKPRCVIEKLMQLPGSGSSGSNDDGGLQLGVVEDQVDANTASGRFLYRITSRGTGGVGDAVVILQSTFATGQ